jgi:hypothetical protein
MEEKIKNFYAGQWIDSIDCAKGEVSRLIKLFIEDDEMPCLVVQTSINNLFFIEKKGTRMNVHTVIFSFGDSIFGDLPFNEKALMSEPIHENKALSINLIREVISKGSFAWTNMENANTILNLPVDENSKKGIEKFMIENADWVRSVRENPIEIKST